MASGCGQDEQKREGGGGSPGTGSEVTIEETVGSAEGRPPELQPGGSPPEDQSGGAGDEEPARVQALLTGRGGRIGPPLVRVPPYISVQVRLRAADAKGRYAVRVRGRVVRATPGRPGTATLAGLRPRQAVQARPLAGGKSIRIEASAQPGP